MMGLIGKNVGNYRIIAKIGEGGMGCVYLGEHPQIGKRVAVKVLHEELASREDIVSRFFTEAKAANQIGHPNIVDIVDFGRLKDQDTGADVVYFVMEFLDGEGLNSRLKREGVSITEAVSIADQCAAALSASHGKGIIHRDLKPENIYLVHRGAERNYVKLLDFGIAKLTGDTNVSTHKTRTGLVIGTPSYMSPEQCEGKGNIDWRSDIYSIGIVFYEMLTGQVPFPGEGFGEVLVSHLTKPAPLPSSIRQDVPKDLEAIVMHAIEKKREKRFQSMDEFRAALMDRAGHLASYGVGLQAAGTMLLDAPVATAGQLPRNTRGVPLIDPGQQALRATTGVQPRVTGNNTAVLVGPVSTEGPRATTLTGASGEVAAHTGGSKAPLFAALGVVLLGALGGGGYFLFLRGKDHKTVDTAVVQTPVTPPTTPPKVEDIHISVDSTPRGAEIYKPGVVDSVGTTPYKMTLKPGSPDFDITVKLPGYKDATRTVKSVRDVDMLIALEKAPPAAPVAVAEPPKEHHHSSSSSHASAGHAASGGKKKGGAGSSGDNDGTLEPAF